MKKILLGTLAFFILGIGALFYIGEEYRDRFNPLVKEKDVYVVINEEGTLDPDYPERFKYYMYMLDGVDETGLVEKIKVTSTEKSFPENTFLKVHVKGKYVYSFSGIEEQQIPEQAKNKLKK